VVVGAELVVAEPGDVVGVVELVVLVSLPETLVVVAAGSIVLDDPPPGGSGAATWRGGRSLTLASAALTICQVTAVAKAATSTHAPTMLHLLTGILSQQVGSTPSSIVQGFLKPYTVAGGTDNLPGMARIVLVEDDVEIRRLVADALAAQGHDVDSAGIALEGLQLAVKGDPDLVVMDLGLPDLDGSELLRMIRSVSQVPVIVITARGADEVVVRTLDAGADDYLVKPFSVAQLEARVRALLRRGPAAEAGAQIKVGGLTIDPAAREVSLDGSDLDLSPKEFDMLRALAERVGEVVSKRALMAEVWREPYGGAERTVDVHLSWLRNKLGETAQQPRYLRTVHGVGVKLVDPTR
jgi:two-component system KDP operon response regulator KdpE